MTSSNGATIKVIGVGGGGGNAINNMIAGGLEGVDFIAANTDKQALDHNLADIKIQVGIETTRGLGAGADPEVGKKSVMENTDEMKKYLESSDMVFVTGGMGGGTGTGGAPIIAKIAKELGALVVGIVTKPFNWEGRKRTAIAEQGISELREHVDALICIPNQKLLDIIDKNTSFGEAFRKVDEVLYNATKGIADIISRHGVVNVDFADVKTVMKGMGDALMGIGTASGEHRATEATQNALNSPLLDGISISGAKGVLVNISGGSDMTMHEVAEAVGIVEQAAGDNANLIHGVVYGPEDSDEITVTVVATGFNISSDIKESETKEINSKPENTEIPNYFNDSLFKTSFMDNNKIKEFESEKNTDLSTRVSIKKSVIKTYIDNEIQSSPRGHGQLSKYERPAYERKNVQLTNNAEEVKSKQNNEVDNNNQDYDMEDEFVFSNEPAFLRKIMD